MTLLSNLFMHYARILATDLAKNDRKIRETYNTNDPPKSLYTRLNECVDYVSAAGKPIPEGQVVHIAYSLVVETGKFQEDFRTWRAKSEQNKTWTTFQAHFIEAQSNLRER